MKNFEVAVNCGQYVLTATQENEIFQTISLVLSIVCSCVIIASKVYKWWKTAIADKKITKEEVEDLIEDVKPDVDNIIDKTNEH